MSVYYSSLVSFQELEWWLAHDPASFPPIPVADHHYYEDREGSQEAFYQHVASPPSFSYPSPDRTPPMGFASVPALTIDSLTTATAMGIPLVTPLHDNNNIKTSSKRKNSNDAPKKKRFQCSYCTRDFSRDADRKRHEDCVHFGIRGFHCPYYGCLSKGFVRSYDLGRHMKSCRFRH